MSEGTEIQVGPETTALAPKSPDVMQLMERALSHGPEGVAALEKLIELKNRQDDREAARTFAGALATFQAECPELPKTRAIKHLGGATRDGRRVGVHYTPIDELDRIVKPVLRKHGFAYSWDQVCTPEQVTATCILRHVDGHHGSASATVPVRVVMSRSKANPPKRRDRPC